MSGENEPTLLSLSLLRLGNDIRQRLEHALKRHGVKPRHLHLLRGLGDGKPHSQLALARKVGVHPSYLVEGIDELLGFGLIERCSSDDRRQHPVRLTPLGKEKLPFILEEAANVETEVFATLSKDEREQLFRYLRIALEAA